MITPYPLIYDLCKVRNLGLAGMYDPLPTPRVRWIEETLRQVGIPYQLDTWEVMGRHYWNIIVEPSGNTGLYLMAHHDIVNIHVDNANDNSASIINLIAARLLRPEVGLVFTDGEEIGGVGAARWASQLETLHKSSISVLNLELTGRGGLNWFIGDDPMGKLKNYLVTNFNPDLVRVPFNDSVVLRRLGVDSCVINPLPKLESGEWDFARLRWCHSQFDRVEEISVEEMQQFVEGVIIKIIDGWNQGFEESPEK